VSCTRTAAGRVIGIPGDLKAYKFAHDMYGRLPWADLFKPTIAMVKDGFPISGTTVNSLKFILGYYKLPNLLSMPSLW